MRIVVAVKYVPDVHAEREIVAGRLVRRAEEGTLNELDENAVEAALRIVESLSQDEQAASEIIALTMAPPAADAALRKTYQLGVDRAVRITDDALAGSDYFATARVLGAAIEKLADESPVDLVITGMAALDGLGSVMPTLVAADLGWPALTLAAGVEIDPAARTATVTRELDDAEDVLAAPLPAVVSVTDHANDPRMPNFQLIMAARRKPIETWSLADLAVDAATVGESGSRTKVTEASARPPRPEAQIVVDKGSGGLELADFLIRNELV